MSSAANIEATVGAKDRTDIFDDGDPRDIPPKKRDAFRKVASATQLQWSHASLHAMFICGALPVNLFRGEPYVLAVRANRQAGGNAWKHHASDAVRERALARVSGGKAFNSIRSKRCCSMSNRTSNW